MTVLYVSEELSFTDLQKELERLGVKTTKGNLQHHLNKLKERGLVEKKYVPFFLSRRKAVYKITERGEEELREFIKEMRNLEELVSDGYKYIYFPYDDLWEKLVSEAERRNVGIHELLKDIIEWYFGVKAKPT